MELEQSNSFIFVFEYIYYIIPIWNWSFQALILNHSHNFYYIIPIWNWSRYLYLVRMRLLIITLFLYGIGAFYELAKILAFSYNYIIPIWNWSYSLVDLLCSLHFKLHYSYMELEQSKSNPSCKSLIITLFLYGIGAVLLSSHFQLHLITLFLYGIGANRICKRRT